MRQPARPVANYQRRSIRLPGYDYSLPGAYFVTICTHDRELLFGGITNGEMRLNPLGELVKFTWFDLMNHVKNIHLGPFGIMPNHVHGIIRIVGVDHEPVGAGVGAGSEPATTTNAPTTVQTALPEIVRQFKTFSARRINGARNTHGLLVWQRNYWEHIIRDENSYHEIAEYIRNNPAQWEMDADYP